MHLTRVEMSARLMATSSHLQKLIHRGKLRQEAFADIDISNTSAETPQLTDEFR
jgi:hypothetical protein